jgi:hypothetical protein
MRKLLLSLTMFSICFGLEAQNGKLLQQVNFNLGRTFSNFLYKDANGNKDENLSYRSGNTYNLSVGLGFGAKHLLRSEFQYSELGAQSSFLDAPVDWKLNYLGVGASYLFKVINKETISLSPGVIVGYDYLLKGEQTVGGTRYNLNQNDALKAWDLNAGLLLNSRFKVTETLYLNFEYRFNMGLNQIEKQDKGEKTKNIGHKALMGLSFNL